MCVREKQFCSPAPPCSVGLDEFLTAQLDPLCSCPDFTPAIRTHSVFLSSLALFLSLWSGLGQGQRKDSELRKI